MGSVRRICRGASASLGALFGMFFCFGAKIFVVFVSFPGARQSAVGAVDYVRYIAGLFSIFWYEQIVACFWEGFSFPRELLRFLSK